MQKTAKQQEKVFNLIEDEYGPEVRYVLNHIQKEYGNQIPNDIVVYELENNNLMEELVENGLARRVGDGIPQQFYKIDEDCDVLNEEMS